MLSKCNYSYVNLKGIFGAAATTLIENKNMTSEEAQKCLTFSLGVLKVCETNKEVAQKLLFKAKTIGMVEQ